MGVCDMADAFPTRRVQLEVATTNMGTIALFIQGSQGDQCVSDRWGVQGVIEDELSLSSPVWYMDG